MKPRPSFDEAEYAKPNIGTAGLAMFDAEQPWL